MDRISELPDDILVSLISAIGLKEAAKTSILSKRWRYLWAKETHLDFNHLLVLPDADPYVEKNIASAKRSKYINWVNQVVGVHCGPCIDTFKVSFFFDGSDAHHIDKWMRFAILKKVKDLVLNLSSSSWDNLCTLGFDILQPPLSPGDGDISFLKSLHLNNISVSGDVLEFILSRCHLLERVHVEYSKTLVRLKVIGQSCKLKQLTIYACPWLEELEIDSANLMCANITFASSSLNLMIKSAPVLVEVRVVGMYEFESILPPIFQLAFQISKFTLGLVDEEIPLLPTFSHLKHLTLLIEIDDYPIDNVAIATMLVACPAVCEFKLEITWLFRDLITTEAYILSIADLLGDISESEDSVVPPLKTHRNLKVLHVAGFRGYSDDVNFILYFVDFACNLKTIICDSTHCSRETHSPGCLETVTSRVAKLRKIVPRKIHVEII